MSRHYLFRRGTPLAVFAFVVGAAAIYVTKPRPGNAPSSPITTGATETTPGGAPLSTFVRKPSPEPLPNVAFQNGDGQPLTLENFRGKVVLLNLWATWCIPCRKEMPALERLQSAIGADDFEVVALSIDRSGAAGARKFLDSIGVGKLKLYVDPTAKLANDFKAIGLPTTLLIDRQGREIGRLIGPAEWDDAASQTLVKAALADR